MPADVLERVRSDIEKRLGELAGPVAEAQRLETALGALGGLAGPSARKNSTPIASAAARKTRRARRAAGRRGHKKLSGNSLTPSKTL
jgi:hypothetical protein